MKLANRVQRVGESATLAVSRQAKELRASGIDVIDFSAGEPDFDSPPSAVEAACKALREGKTRYTAATGLPELRHAVAADYNQRYGAPWSGDNVVITVGGKAALFELALATVGVGDEVVIPLPYWVTFPEQVRLAGGDPVFVETSVDDGFRLRADAVCSRLSERTRVVILNSPSNPTGRLIERGDLEQIVERCAERGILVIADETYDRFVFGDEPFASAAPLAHRFGDVVVVVGSFSKTYAMTGWRIGYMLGPPDVVRAVGTIQSHATSNPTTFAMYGALAALGEAESRVEEMLRAYRGRRALIERLLADLPGVRCAAPVGAFYVFPEVSECYRDGRQGSVEFSRFLLEKARVAVVPGIAFGCDDHIRISFACSEERLQTGLDRIRDAIL
ncbi:MAG: pyridoxal phosphate-dependent aminotransferase [Acidobacteriota bacterium]|nr:pyridoxal phosphate-dependent aminotransferase [Acidobacteriota bacterium]